MKQMKCKNCGYTDAKGEVNVSIYQNLFSKFSKGQYVFLCQSCYKRLTNPMLNESYRESGSIQQFQDRLNQIM